MHKLRVSLDPCNPGQFYSCCGIVELCELAGARTLSHFEIDCRQPRRATFILHDATEALINSVVEGLGNSNNYQYFSRPTGSDAKTKRSAEGADKAAAVRIECGTSFFDLDWWLDRYHENLSPLKLWPGRATTQTVLASLLGAFPKSINVEDALSSSFAYLTGRFGIDPRSSWDAQDLGYSPHAQSQPVQTFPLVEIFGAIGLQGFRPTEISPKEYRYHAWGKPLPLSVARVACSELWRGLPGWEFSFSLEARSSRSSRIGFASLEKEFKGAVQ